MDAEWKGRLRGELERMAREPTGDERVWEVEEVARGVLGEMVDGDDGLGEEVKSGSK